MRSISVRSVFLLLVLCGAGYGQYLVSARSLAHRVPGRAAKEYQRSLESIRAGGYPEGYRAPPRRPAPRR